MKHFFISLLLFTTLLSPVTSFAASIEGEYDPAEETEQDPTPIYQINVSDQLPINTSILGNINTQTNFTLPKNTTTDPQPTIPDSQPSISGEQFGEFDAGVDVEEPATQQNDQDLSGENFGEFQGQAEVNIPAEQRELDPMCRIIAQGNKHDDGSLNIRAAIRYSDLPEGRFQYGIFGAQDVQANDDEQYEGTLTIDEHGADGIIYLHETTGFGFTYTPTNEEKNFVINAYIADLTCSSVIFPASLVINNQEPSEDDTTGVTAGSVDYDTNGNVRYIPVGVGAKDTNVLQTLDAKDTPSNEPSETLQEEIDETPQTTTIEEDEHSDILLYSLLGLIAVLLLGMIGVLVKKQP